MLTNIDIYFHAANEFKVVFFLGGGDFYRNIKYHLQSDCSIDIDPIKQNLLT